MWHTIEDLEMEYQERTENLYYVNTNEDSPAESITIATTRPETIYADSGLLFTQTILNFLNLWVKMLLIL